MDNNLLNILNNNTSFQLVKFLSLFKKGLHLRELAALCNLSASTVSDTTKKLVKVKVLKKKKRGNKIYFTCNLSEVEEQIVRLCIEQDRKDKGIRSSSQLSTKAYDLLLWNNEMLNLINTTKEKHATTRFI